MSASIPDPAARRRPEFDLDAPDDATFIARAPQIEAYLLANFAGLRGLQQHRPHFDPARERTTDPIEHTLEVLAALDTRDLDQEDARILRAATIFHDVGKLLNPLNVRHAIDSAAICPPYLPDFGLDPAACADAVAIVRDHDVLGRICQGRLTVDDAMEIFGTPRLANLTGRMTRADVGSIRGLTRVVSSIEAANAAVLALFTARQYSQRFTPPEPTEAVAKILGRLTPQAKLWIEIEGEIGLSQWRMALLEAVEATGSLAKAAEQLAIPYRTARYKLREIEQHLGLRLLAGRSGGAKGGASAITPEARELIARWRVFNSGLNEWATNRFGKTFRE